MTTQKTVIVLGGHKSGTSATAGMLAELGVDLGRQLRGADDRNPFGYFEDVEVLRLNDKILAAAGGSAWDPPALTSVRCAIPGFRDEIMDFVARRRSGGQLWGWKATTTLMTIDAYMEFLDSVYFIAVFRNPYRVALSAVDHTRGEIELAEQLKLANFWNSRIVEILAEYPTAQQLILAYEDMQRNPSAAALALADFLSVDLQARDLSRVVSRIHSPELLASARSEARWLTGLPRYHPARVFWWIKRNYSNKGMRGLLDGLRERTRTK